MHGLGEGVGLLYCWVPQWLSVVQDFHQRCVLPAITDQQYPFLLHLIWSFWGVVVSLWGRMGGREGGREGRGGEEERGRGGEGGRGPAHGVIPFW